MNTKAHPLLGKWRITGMERRDAEFSGLPGPGTVRLNADGGGEFAFGAVQGGIDGHPCGQNIHFTCEGNDKMDPARGDGDAQLGEDGTLCGKIRFHQGDEASFIAHRW